MTDNKIINKGDMEIFIKKRKIFIIKQKLKHNTSNTCHFIQENEKKPVPGVTLNNDIMCHYQYLQEPFRKQVVPPSSLSYESHSQEILNKDFHQE